MKRIYALLLIALILTLSACIGSANKWKPITASNDIKPYGEQAIKIIDQYLNFEIDSDEAEEKLDSLSRRLIGIDTDDKNSKYNSADKVIIDTIDYYADYSIDFKSDEELRQTLDILAVQIGQKTSGKVYNPNEYTSLEDEENLDLFIDTASSTAEYGWVRQGDDSYSVSLSFDAMYGAKALHVQTSVNEILSNSQMNELNLRYISVYFRYYDQTVFTVSVYIYKETISGKIYLDSTDTIFAEFNSREEMNSALEQIIEFANIK